MIEAPEPPTSYLPNLPSELIDHILSYLAPVDLVSTSLVNRTLHSHANADHIWQQIVQAHIPGTKLTTPHPCESYRELYIAHDPHWFLTKYKVWFCDRDLTGKLIIARYDERRGVIEGYQLLANSNLEENVVTNNPNLNPDRDVVIHAFEPALKLHLDKPVLQLRANSLENSMRRATSRASSTASIPAITTMSPLFSKFSTLGAPSPTFPSTSSNLNRFSAETPMPLDDRPADTMFSNFMLSRAMPEPKAKQLSARSFPYGNVWPPPAIPTEERTAAASLYHRDGGGELIAAEDRPTARAQVSEKSFRIRSWMEMRPASLRGVSLGNLMRDGNSDTQSDGVYGQASRPWLASLVSSLMTNTIDLSGGIPSQPVGMHIGEEITTYSTIEPDLYTPTAEMPWKGIWVGDYSAHGCEFLLVNQSHAKDPFNEAVFDATRAEDESDSEFEARKAGAKMYRGRLEAVKLTGDPNVPRGETSFMAEDLGEKGYVTTVQDEPFFGARVVRSRGHVASTGFVNGECFCLHFPKTE